MEAPGSSAGADVLPSRVTWSHLGNEEVKEEE